MRLGREFVGWLVKIELQSYLGAATVPGMDNITRWGNQEATSETDEVNENQELEAGRWH